MPLLTKKSTRVRKLAKCLVTDEKNTYLGWLNSKHTKPTLPVLLEVALALIVSFAYAHTLCTSKCEIIAIKKCGW